MAKRRETNSRTISSKRWYKQAQNAYLSLSLSFSFSRAHGHTRRQHAKKQNKDEEKKQLKKKKLGPNQQYVFNKEKKIQNVT
jgi:hypothetical protein